MLQPSVQIINQPAFACERSRQANVWGWQLLRKVFFAIKADQSPTHRLFLHKWHLELGAELSSRGRGRKHQVYLFTYLFYCFLLSERGGSLYVPTWSGTCSVEHTGLKLTTILLPLLLWLLVWVIKSIEPHDSKWGRGEFSKSELWETHELIAQKS